MTKDDILRMAREAGGLPDPMIFIGAYERFGQALLAMEEKLNAPWVSLTQEEILDLFDVTNVYGSKWIEFARAVEDKLKEKNT